MPFVAPPSTAAGGPPPRATARGAVQIFASQGAMAVSGLAIHVALTRLLPPEDYGVLAVVTSVILWWALLGSQLFLRATTRFVAAAGERWGEVAGTALAGTAVWCSTLTVAVFLSAPGISRLLGDPGLAPYLRLFSVDVLLNGLFQTSRAILVGRRRYRDHATAFALYWGFKAVAVCGLVAAGLGIRGAILGSVAASAAGLALAWLAGGWATGRGFPLRRLVTFSLPLLGVALVYQTLLHLDLWWLKAAGASGLTIGRYGLAKYTFLMLITFGTSAGIAMLPSLTRAIEENLRESVRELVQQSFRFVLLFGLGAVAALGAGAEGLLELVFSSSYREAALPMVLLSVAAVAFSAAGVAVSVLTAAGRPWWCLAGVVPALPIAVGLNLWLVPARGVAGAGLAAILAGAALVLPLALLIRRALGVFVLPWSSLRIAAAAGLVLLAGRTLSPGGFLAVIEPLIAFGSYLLLLLLVGELTRRDLELLPFWPR